MRSAFVVPACVAAAVGMGVPALGAKPGATYDGRTSQGAPADARVASTGTVLQLVFNESFRCDMGGRLNVSNRYVRQAPTIRDDGTFDYRKRYASPPAIRGIGPHSQSQHLTGSVTSRTVRVRSVSAIRAKRGSRVCRSTVTMTLRRR